MPSDDPRIQAFERLLNIMDDLREQCPWDKKQTFESLRKLTIEETYELADAIDQKDLSEIEGEIGDLLLHMVFYAKLGSETGAFDITSALNRICEKLIHRHPHIYGDVEVKDVEEVKANWEKLKLKEGKTSVLQGVPNALPAMVKAIRIQEKVKGVGFDWENRDQVWEKVHEELNELHEQIDLNNPEEKEMEFGDVLFSLINYSRFLDLDPEAALEKTNRKFIKRFQYLEAETKAQGRDLHNMSLEEMDEIWNRGKKEA
jgi:XTP/dITP diphosphohydrolase